MVWYVVIKKIKRLTITLIISFTGCLAHADDVDTLFSMSLEQLLSVQVSTASKRSQEARVAPSIISVFTKEDIAKMGVTSLIDVLKHAPGIETSIAPSGNWRVSIRGARKDGIILLLIDGHPFNDLYDGSASFDLPLALVDKVEIIRGPGSALYGTNAVAGIINVLTQKNTSQIAVGFGSRSDLNAAVANQHQIWAGKLSYNIGFTSSDGANIEEGADILDTSNVNFDIPNKTNRYLDEYFVSVNYQNNDFEVSLFNLDRERGPWVGPLNIFGPSTKVDKSQTTLKGKYSYQLSNFYDI